MMTDVNTWRYFFEAIHVKIVECEVVVFIAGITDL
jgi:hypothetical protein